MYVCGLPFFERAGNHYWPQELSPWEKAYKVQSKDKPQLGDAGQGLRICFTFKTGSNTHVALRLASLLGRQTHIHAVF